MDAFISGLHVTRLTGASEFGAVTSGRNALEFDANLEEVPTSPAEGDGDDFRTSRSSAEDRQQNKNQRLKSKTKSDIPRNAFRP